jgi:hypothetical protein
MNKKEWLTGLMVGIASGVGVHSLKNVTPVYKMKYQSKKQNFYESGKTQYNVIESARQRLKVKAHENTKLKEK